MKDIKFTLYESIYIGSGYSDWEIVYGFRYERELNLSKLKDILQSTSWAKFKIVITVTQTDFTELTLYEHEVTFDYLSQLSMCKKPFELLGITVTE